MYSIIRNIRFTHPSNVFRENVKIHSFPRKLKLRYEMARKNLSVGLKFSKTSKTTSEMLKEIWLIIRTLSVCLKPKTWTDWAPLSGNFNYWYCGGSKFFPPNIFSTFGKTNKGGGSYPHDTLGWITPMKGNAATP